MKNFMKKITVLFILVLVLSLVCLPAYAAADEGEAALPADTSESVETNEEAAEDSFTGAKAIAAAAVIGLVATAGAIGMSMAIVKSVESISRQPEAEGAVRTSLMLGLVFIETAIIYALIVAIMIIFVL